MSAEGDTFRTLVVDDEVVARDRLRRLLVSDPRITVVGEAGDAGAAIRLAAEADAEIVFLDIRMRDADGFAVARALEPSGIAIVFVTAYDEYALRAFDAHTVDYLVKPVERDRLARAVARAIRAAELRRAATFDRRHPGDARRPSASEMAELWSQLTQADRLAVNTGRRTLFIPVPDIEWIEADGNYVRLHVGKRNYLIRDTIARLAQVLGPRRFVRIHRSAIVNTSRVIALEPLVNGDSKLTLASGVTVAASRTYRRALLERLSPSL